MLRPLASSLAPRLDLSTTPTSGPSIRWLGTAGIAIEHEGHTLLIDPYVSRRSIADCVRAPLRPDFGAIARIVPNADAIVLGHTHIDHALDAPTIAKATGALVLGSRSAATLCRREGVPASQVVDVESRLGVGGYATEVGPFKLRFFASAHSKLILGRVPFAGEIDDCDAVPIRTEGYKCGAVFCAEITVGGRRFVHLGSADLVEAALPRDVQGADLMFLTVAGWTKTPRFPERMLRAFDPSRILLSHWDDFFAPVDLPPRALPAMGMDRLVDAITQESARAQLGWVPMLARHWT
ncbi:MAG: MBL fold metallo-hydrolase [Polyangiales bacterium]